MIQIDMQVHLLQYYPNDVNQFYGGVIAALASALSYLDISKMQGQYHPRYQAQMCQYRERL